MNTYRYRELPVCYLASGLELRVPLHEITGGAGPVVGLTASIHGDESIGVEVLRNILEFLKTVPVKGTVWMVPVANPLAFEDVDRSTPQDRKNLNRSFPGKSGGTVTDALAHVIAEEFLDKVDVYIDFHSGGQDALVDYVYINNDEGLSRAFLSGVLYRPAKGYEGTSASRTKARGVPTVTIECGGGANPAAYIERGIRGIQNMLRYLGVIEGAVETRDDAMVITRLAHVNPSHGGLLVPCLHEGDMHRVLDGGAVLGRVYNPMTCALLQEIVAPFERNLVILLRGGVNRILPGDFTFMIGDLASRE